MNTIVLYTIPGCSKCAAVQKYFEKNGIPYIEADLLRDKSFVQEIKAYAGEVKVPAVVVDHHVLTDYEEIIRWFAI